MKKNLLRKAYKADRKALRNTIYSVKNEKILQNVEKTFDLKKIKVLIFLPIEGNNEVDLTTLISRCEAAYLPKLTSDNLAMDAVAYTSDLKRHPFGMLEPKNEFVVDPKLIDLVLVPLLCFDQRGFRVGYGGGYYDDFLKQCSDSCLKVGVSLFEVGPHINDIHPGDVALDMVVTPDNIYYF